LNLLQYAVPIGAVIWAMSRVFRTSSSKTASPRESAQLDAAPRPA
jgi:hypothetical protein